MTQILPLPPGAVDPGAAPVTSVDQLVERLARGAKTGTLKVGTEHEKLGIRLKDGSRVPYEGPDGLGAMLVEMAEKYGHTLVEEAGRPIALSRRGAAVSLEPGGQLELSGAPHVSLHDAEKELDEHLREVASVAGPRGVAFYGVGFDPLHGNDAIPWMPKSRYRTMAQHMRASGNLGVDMMLRTCTVQANLDYRSEADMGLKLQTGLGISSVVTALFAASPFVERHPAGWQSHRMRTWLDTDNTRVGLLRFALEEPATFRAYVEWALDVPLIFIRRGADYLPPPKGLTFRRWMGGVDGLEHPTLNDFDDVLSTLFPDVRLKTYLEVRTADCGPRAHLLALPALWKGILYDEGARKRAWPLVSRLTFRDHVELREAAARHGLRARVAGLDAAEAAVELCLAAQDGLRAQGCSDEAGYLEPMLARARSRRTLADEMLDYRQGEWPELGGNLTRLC
ncbi:MAG: glutamate-cysteine ligase family protein [Myxococcota bacterium]